MKKENAQQSTDFWSEDYLERKHIAQYLTKFLQSRYSYQKTEAGFVMAINADWGYGKTYLLTRWAKELSHLGYPTVYFDAWQNDFTPEPLVAFMAKMDESLSEHFKVVPVAQRLMKEAVQKAAPMLKPVGMAVFGAAVKIATGISAERLISALNDPDDLEEIDADDERKKGLKSLEQYLSKAIQSSLQEHKTKSKAIAAFKGKLKLLVDALEKKKGIQLPIVFFVDELDRCRPDYAIELLEGIKHLFGVRGIYFVIGTNIEQLSHSVKAVYGEQFDGNRYLKRFFDFQFNLPEPIHENFTKYHFSLGAIPTGVNLLDGLDVEHYGEDAEMRNAIVFEIYASAFDLTLRDREAVMRILQGAFAAFSAGDVHVHFLYFLAILCFQDPASFQRLRTGAVSGEILAGEHIKNAKKIHAKKLHRGDFTRSFIDAEVSPLSVIGEYFRVAKSSGQKLLETQIEMETFPGKLFQLVRQEVLNLPPHKQAVYVNSLQSYIDIIQYAGKFS